MSDLKTNQLGWKFPAGALASTVVASFLLPHLGVHPLGLSAEQNNDAIHEQNRNDNRKTLKPIEKLPRVTNLEGSDLKKATISSSMLQNANLRNTDLRGGITIDGKHYEGKELQAKLSRLGADFEGARFFDSSTQDPEL